MFTFITSGFEHSIANMCGLMLGLLLPDHGSGITLMGYGYNLGLATIGNIIGGAVFVALLYWIGSPRARERVAGDQAPHSNGVAGTVPMGRHELEEVH